MASSGRKQPKFRELDEDEQGVALEQRREHLAQQTAIKRLNACFKSNPQAAIMCKEFLERKGIELPQTSRQVARANSKNLDVGAVKSEKDECHDDIVKAENLETPSKEPPRPKKVRKTCEVEDPDPKNWLPNAYNRLENCKAPVLEQILATLQPINYASYFLKKVKTAEKMDAETYHRCLAQIVEYETGWPIHEPITGAMKHLPSLLETMRTRASKRTCSPVSLPPMWESGAHGVYTLLPDADGSLLVRQKWSKLQVGLASAIGIWIDELHPTVSQEDLTIVNNYSERDASLSVPWSDEVLVISELVPDEPESQNSESHSVKQEPAEPEAKVFKRLPSFRSPKRRQSP